MLLQRCEVTGKAGKLVFEGRYQNFVKGNWTSLLEAARNNCNKKQARQELSEEEELQKVLRETHGAAVWVLLARCIGVLTLIANQLRQVDVSRDRPGEHAARRVSLTQQAALLRQLSVRLRPTQQAACPFPPNEIW